MKQLEITAIIPTYNKSSYLDIVLFSIKEYIPELNILIIDDGSFDDTKRTVENYKSYLNLDYLYKKNGGLSSARNIGVQYADSKYILFLDDDRFFLENALKDISMKKNQICIGVRKEVYFNNFEMLKRMIQSETNNLKMRSVYERYYRKVKPLSNVEINMIPWVMCTFSNTILSRDVVLEAHGFDECFKGWGFEDLELAYRIYKLIPNIEFKLDEKLINYHVFHSHKRMILEQKERNYNLFYKKHSNYEVGL